MNKSQIAEAYVHLGRNMNVIPAHILETANAKNNWFTIDNIRKAAEAWAYALRDEAVEKWFEKIGFSVSDEKVGIIMAGNIPFVGLHDLLSVLATGKKAVVKLSSQDEVLMGHVILLLKLEVPQLEDRIIISENMSGIDYLIATGSNNSSRYFEYYFSKIPSLIRKSRTSIAVLNGKESDKELLALADDIYTFFGLGCRNITHLLLPTGFELKRLYEAYDKYIDIIQHHKYYNNYMYHKSILLMNLSKHYDNGFMLFQEKDALHAPIATLNYHFYNDIKEAQEYIDRRTDELQCVVSNAIENAIPFGRAQFPELWDYADGVNIIEFLGALKEAKA